MKVTLLQTDISWAKPDENVRNAQRLLDMHPGSDLYVLPEMWATGFATEPHGVAENTDSIALEWMLLTARQRHCALSGSLALQLADGTYRNRHFFVTPEGVAAHYDKHHLFTYGGEHRHITAGRQNVVAQWQGRRFLLLTCYDLRFPLWARYGRAGEYDAIIVVANWPESRQQAWRVLTRARAIENQCYLMGANRVGDDQYCHYRGESVVCDSKGDTLAEGLPHVPSGVTAVLDFDRQDRARQRFGVLADRDRF